MCPPTHPNYAASGEMTEAGKEHKKSNYIPEGILRQAQNDNVKRGKAKAGKYALADSSLAFKNDARAERMTRKGKTGKSVALADRKGSSHTQRSLRYGRDDKVGGVCAVKTTYGGFFGKFRMTMVAVCACVCAGLLFLCSFFGFWGNNDVKAEAFSTTNKIGEIYNSETKKFNRTQMNEVAKLIDSNATDYIDLVEDLIEQAENSSPHEIITATDLKYKGKYCTITFGGIEWMPVYFSFDKDKNPVLTLWQASSDENLSSPFNISSVDSKSNTPSSNDYGTSYIRAVTLQNSETYYDNGSEQTSSFNKSNVYYKFAQGDLSGFIDSPSNMSWQLSQSAQGDLAYDTTNNYSSTNKTGAGYYTVDWGDDKVWLPSMYETYYGTMYDNDTADTSYEKTTKDCGLWNLPEGELPNTVFGWLRSGSGVNYNFSYLLGIYGLSGAYDVSTYYGVRPAIHLNLNSAAKSLGFSEPTEVTNTYDGTTQTIASLETAPAWYKADYMEFDYPSGKTDVGTNNMTDVGTYKVKVSLVNTSYPFEGTPADGETKQSRYFNFKITAKPLAVTFKYNSDNQPTSVTIDTSQICGDDTVTPELKYKGINGTSYTESTIMPTDKGSYRATAYIKDNDNYTIDKTKTYYVDFTIEAKKVAVPTITSNSTNSATANTATYTGSDIDFNLSTSNGITFSNLPDGVTYVNGVLTAKNVNTYKINVSLSDATNCVWGDNDGGNGQRPLTIIITAKEIAVPTISSNSTGSTTAEEAQYTGSVIDFTLSSSTGIKITPPNTDVTYADGKLSATKAGTYNITVDLADTNNTVWSDDKSTASKTLTFTISNGGVTVPYITQNSTGSATASTAAYTGNGITFTLNSSSVKDIDVDKNSLPTGVTYASGVITATKVGTYNITVELADKANTIWGDSDGGTDSRTVTFTISRATLTVVWASTSFTYNGSTPTGLITNLTGFCSTQDETDSKKDYIAELENTLTGLKTDAGSYSVRLAQANLGTNYKIDATAGTYTISPAPLAVTGDPATTSLNTPPTALTASASGWIDADNTEANLAIIDAMLYVGDNYNSTTSPKGTYTILFDENNTYKTANGTYILSALPNYEITYTSGKLTVSGVIFTVTFNLNNEVAYGEPAANVLALGTANYTISSNYNPATQGALTVATDYLDNMSAGSSFHFTVTGYDTNDYGVKYVYSGSATTNATKTAYVVQKRLLGAADITFGTFSHTYDGTAQTQTATVNLPNLSVAMPPLTLTYVKSGDTTNTVLNAITDAGTYTATVAFAGTETNWELPSADITTTVTIAQKALTVALSNSTYSITYGDKFSVDTIGLVLTGLVSPKDDGLKNEFTVAAAYNNKPLTTSTLPSSDVYTISVSYSNKLDNYAVDVSGVNGTVTVGKRKVDLTVSYKTYQFGEAAEGTLDDGLTLTNVVSSDKISDMFTFTYYYEPINGTKKLIADPSLYPQVDSDGNIKEQGTYYVTVELTTKGAARYEWTSSAPTDTEFAEVAGTGAVAINVSVTSWMEGETPVAPTYTITPADDNGVAFVATIEWFDSDSGKWVAWDSSTPSDAGTYSVRVSVAATSNFEATSSKPVTLTVTADPNKPSTSNSNGGGSGNNSGSGSGNNSGSGSGNNGNNNNSDTNNNGGDTANVGGNGSGDLGDGFTFKLSNIPEGFPLWQVIVSVLSIILGLIFYCKAIANIKAAKRAKNEAANYSVGLPALLYAFLGLAESSWTVIALVLLGVCALGFILMLITGGVKNNAEYACAKAKADYDKAERKRKDDQMNMVIMSMSGASKHGNVIDDSLSSVNMDVLASKVVAALLPNIQQTNALPAGSKYDAEQIKKQQEQILSTLNQMKNSDGSKIIITNTQPGPAQSSSTDEATKQTLKEQGEAIEKLKKKALTDDDDEDEWSDDEEEEDFYDSDIYDDDQEVVPENKRVRLPSNFRVRLKISSDKCKDFYVELKNGLNSYKGFTFRMSGRLEKVNYHGETIAMIGVVRKALKLWLALDPNAYDFERYHQKDASDKKRYEHVPMQVRIGSARALKRAEELLDRLLENYQAEVRNKYKPKNLQELAYTLKLNKLVKDKRNDLLCQSIHVHDADVISDEDAERYVELRERAPIADENFAVVSLDTLDTEFLDGNKVTLDKLKKKGIVPEECNGYYLTAGKRLSKPLYVIADEISPSAVKMIVLTGGRAIELVAPQPADTTEAV
jgi:hypothetical protein